MRVSVMRAAWIRLIPKLSPKVTAPCAEASRACTAVRTAVRMAEANGAATFTTMPRACPVVGSKRIRPLRMSLNITIALSCAIIPVTRMKTHVTDCTPLFLFELSLFAPCVL